MLRVRLGLVAWGLAAWLGPVAGTAGTTDLADAARAGDRAAVRRLLAQRADPNAPSADGTPALHWAVRANDLDTVALLVRAGAAVTRANRYGVLPIGLAAGNGNAAMIRLLVESGADINAVDAAGESPLVTATAIGAGDAVRTLLDAGAPVDARDRVFSQSALMVAVRANQLALARLFIERGADVNARTRRGDAPNWVLPNSVRGFGHGIGIIRGGLPDRGSRAPVPGEMSPLLYAARDGRLEIAALLLDNGAMIDQADANGTTPLIMALANNHPEVATLLIERGANPRTVDWYGRTALWAAVEARNMELDNATFVNGVDRAPYLPVIERLLSKGVDVNARVQESPPIRRHMLPITGTLAWVDFTGQTPFVTAALSADLETMRLLLKYGADPRLPTYGGTTALMAAAGVNWVVDQTFDEGPAARLAAVTLCVELGLDVRAVNSMGLTALHGAANRGSDDIIRFLVGKGADPSAKDKEGRTPSTWAEGVFLATHPAVAKPTTIALLRELTGVAPAASTGARP
jgi:ankyrin repeat protein